MKQLFLILVVTFMTMSGAQAQNMQKQIEKTVKQFVKGGDQNDISILEDVLHTNHRVAFNDLTSGQLKILDRTTYLQLIKNKTFGGNKRSIIFESVDIYEGITATVKVKFKSEKAIFHNYLSLVKVGDDWKIVQDLTFIK
ncbi:MAG: nuclear transport factor 2 family protein [Flammeovirgaceae bacterium]